MNGKKRSRKSGFSSICPASAYIKSLPHLHENPHDAYPYPHGMPYHGFPCPPERKQKRKRVTLRQKGNRHGWRIRGQSLGRNDMSHSQKAGFDTLAKSQSGLLHPYHGLQKNYAKTAWSSPHERATARYCPKGTLTKPRRSISCNTATNPSQNPSKANKTTFFR